MPRETFDPTAPFWRVNREWLVTLAGPRALLMQLAHPLVAAGVADHSHFRRAPVSRLYHTLSAMNAIGFGTPAEACRAARHIGACHGRVEGTLREDAGPYLAGTPYRANDALLMLWVLATVIDSAMAGYELCVRPLSAEDKAGYYADARRAGAVIGLPPELMPPSHDDFADYMDSMLTSDALVVTPAAREVAGALFSPPFTGRAVRLATFVGIGLLPARLRDEYGLPWGARQERRLARLAGLARRLRRGLPEAAWVQPGAARAERRVRRGGEGT